jgi:CPA1 family monovalent cation:H+ antiporter
VIASIDTFVLLLAVMVIVAIIARRVNIAPSILLVIAGIGLALVPHLPPVELAPDLVLFGILPPLIYSAGVAMSWREFCFNLRPIAHMALGCVLFTATAVAAMAHWILGLPLAVGFVLGAIVSPPDAVAPLATVGQLGLPRRLMVVLEGEGVANDATALILYRFAIAAVAMGVFSIWQAVGSFILIVVGEIAYGVFIGWLSLRLRRWARNARVEITLSLMTPYAAYLVPAHLGGSGVLATVAAGLYVSWNGPLLIPAATRLQGIFFWDLLVYLLNGLVFLVTGLQIRTLLETTDTIFLRGPLIAVGLTVAVLVAARFVWFYPATYLPRWLSANLARRDPLPPWQWIFFMAFVGVRGVVSLAAALGIPLSMASGAPFPYRGLILFVTFGVIVVTLVGQGLLLPAVVRALDLTRYATAERNREHGDELTARREALAQMQSRLQELAAREELPSEAIDVLRARHDDRSGRLPRELPDGPGPAAAAAQLRLQLIDAERQYIYRLLQEGKITDEARRRIERELDLEEASIATWQEGGFEPPL